MCVRFHIAGIERFVAIESVVILNSVLAWYFLPRVRMVHYSLRSSIPVDDFSRISVTQAERFMINTFFRLSPPQSMKNAGRPRRSSYSEPITSRNDAEPLHLPEGSRHQPLSV